MQEQLDEALDGHRVGRRPLAQEGVGHEHAEQQVRQLGGLRRSVTARGRAGEDRRQCGDQLTCDLARILVVVLAAVLMPSVWVGVVLAVIVLSGPAAATWWELRTRRR